MNKTNVSKILKQKKGFTMVDIAVAIVIIMIFVGIITTLFYQYYLSISSKNRNAIATNCVIDIIEDVKAMNYEEVTIDTLNQKIQQFIKDGIIPKGYNVIATIEKYNERPENLDKQDIIKILNVRVEYNSTNKLEQIEISTLITK